MINWWYDKLGQKIRIAPREACTSALLSTANSMWTTLGLNPNIWGEKWGEKNTAPGLWRVET
jgi:hypothetical protein